LVKRYLRAEVHASGLSGSHWQIVGSEVLLYLGDVLLQMQSNPQTPKYVGEYPLGLLLFPRP
jgi:hypothetical protein